MVLHLSQANLGEAKKDKGGESICLYVTVDEKKLVLATLNTEKLPQQQFDLVFDRDFEISHNWKNGILWYHIKVVCLVISLTMFSFVLTDEEDDEFDSDEDIPLHTSNGKPDTKAKPEKPAVADKANATKDSASGKQKVESGKKRPPESSKKTPVPEKKVKMATPQKTDGKKGSEHVATPHPSKKAAGKTPNNKAAKQQTPKSGGSHLCKPCNRSFGSESALDSHSKAKHGAGKVVFLLDESGRTGAGFGIATVKSDFNLVFYLKIEEIASFVVEIAESIVLRTPIPPESFYKMVLLSSSFCKAIRLRLIRTYIVTEGRNKSAVKSQECLFHDIELCRAKTVDNEVRISSSYTATKVLFNLDCQEFADFRNSLKANCSPLRSISVVSYGHSANNSQSPMVVSTIRDLYERAEEGYYYVPGTIVSTESGKKWFYNACRKPGCYKSLELKETYYFCDTCKTNWAEGNVRYKVVVRVLDKTSDAPFVLWDKDCFELLGITAYDLKFKYSMESESGDEAISPIVQGNLKLKGVANDQDEVDTGAIKRCLLDQFSSSQNLKKCKALVIKEEKTL
nr:histone deacetylase HDT1-like isoform X2 [Ipomoea trifida]